MEKPVSCRLNSLSSVDCFTSLNDGVGSGGTLKIQKCHLVCNLVSSIESLIPGRVSGFTSSGFTSLNDGVENGGI